MALCETVCPLAPLTGTGCRDWQACGSAVEVRAATPDDQREVMPLVTTLGDDISGVYNK